MMRRLLFFICYNALFLEVSLIMVEREWMIYYDLSSNKTIDIIDSNNPRLKYYKPGTIEGKDLLKIGFGPIPCTCQGFTCGCCAGMNIEYFNFNQRACMNFTYDPQEFSLTMDMLMNDESMYAQSISGKNPPPACVPVPIPYLPSIDFCLKFFNIHTPGYNVFMCVDFLTRVERAPVLVLHFDCMQMGMDGIEYHKPDESESGAEVESPDSEVQNAEEPEIYDEVYEDDYNATSTSAPSKPTISGTTEPGVKVVDEIYDEVFEDDNSTSTKAPVKSLLIADSSAAEKSKIKLPFVDEVYDEVYEENNTTGSDSPKKPSKQVTANLTSADKNEEKNKTTELT